MLHLSWSGHFPFCVPEAAGIWDGTGTPPTGFVGPGTLYPLGLSLAEAMQWYWKVSSWAVASTVDFSGTQPSYPYTFSFSLAESATVAAAASGADLVCPGGVRYDGSYLVFRLFSGSPAAYQLDGLVYPALRLTAARSGAVTVSSYKPDAIFPKGWTAGNCGGHDVPLYYDEASTYDSTTGGDGDRGPWTQTRAGTLTAAAGGPFAG